MAKTKPKKIDHKKQATEDFETKYKRALADYQNLEKRMATQQTQLLRFTTAELLGKFITILDDLERAAQHIDDKGLDMVIDQFKKTLLQEGVSVINPQGELFNPETMECAEQAEGKKNHVTQVLQKGYQLKDTLIRPAQVVVGMGESN